MRRITWGVAVVVTVMAFVSAPMAQDMFPSHPIDIVSPHATGGTVDLQARAVANTLERYVKQPVVVQSKPGASGAIGAQYVANSKPDGYTLLVTDASISIQPQVDRLFGRPSAFAREQFVGLALLSASPVLLVVRADSPLKTVADFVAAAKQRPNELTHGSGGVYATSHLPMEMLKQAMHIRARHVPFTGGAPALRAVLSGSVDMAVVAVSTAVAQAKAGQIRILGSWAGTRIEALPDVPTFKELGYDVESYLWVGMFAPKGVPSQALGVLREAVRQTANDPDFKATMTKMGAPVTYRDAEDFQKFWDKDHETIGRTLAYIGKVETQ